MKPDEAFHSHGNAPIAGWFSMENPKPKWMMTDGTLISGNHHIRTLFGLAMVYVVPFYF